MKIALKRLVSTIVIAQYLAIPIMSVESVAAPTANSTGSKATVTSGASRGTTITLSSPQAFQNTPYFTDEYGNILMNVNIWGNVNVPGPQAVPEGADIASAISLAGGASNSANLEKVRLNREQPDEYGKSTYLLNLSKYAKAGDRSMLIELQPNDTIIVPESHALTFMEILEVLAGGFAVYSVLHFHN
jgi:hypothetical protein